jgi:MraZ protein
MWGISLFRGINVVSLDAKGRMTIPTRYRTQLEAAQNHVVTTIDTEDPCLLLYPLPEWELLENKIEGLPSFNKAARRVQRLLIGHATEIELDGNGRILLPSLLREYASLDKQVVLVGQGKKFEIWSDIIWEKNRQNWLKDEAEEGKSFPLELLNLSI